MKPKRLSPFSIEFWTARGMTIEEADYKRNSFRPIKKEYWIEKGYSEEESVELAIKTKNDNNIKGNKAATSRSKEQIRSTTVRCVEHWLRLGFSLEEAKDKVSQIQTTFTLEKCIEKYGIIEGTSKWQNRQINWQNTLNSRSQTDIDESNKKKCCIRIKNGSMEETVKFYNEKRGMSLVLTIEEYIETLKEQISNNGTIVYWDPVHYVNTRCPNIQLQIFSFTAEELVSKIQHLFSSDGYLLKKGNRQSWRKWVGSSLLRSSYEIYFYDTITRLIPNVELEIDKRYPNSSFRWDFKVGSDYIEICPMYETDEKYRMKMEAKKNLFNCVLLKNTKEIDQYIIGLLDK